MVTWTAVLVAALLLPDGKTTVPVIVALFALLLVVELKEARR